MSKPYPQPPILTCAQWKARPALTTFGTCKIIHPLLHHMDNANGPLHAKHSDAVAHAIEIAQECQDLHMSASVGDSDTGQNFTVTRDGIILEGRHGSIAAINKGVSVIGAQCYMYNSESCGTEHEGTYTNCLPPAQQWEASVKLHAWICDRGGLSSATIDGHRDHCATACPGDAFHAALPKFREDVHAELTKWRTANP